MAEDEDDGEYWEHIDLPGFCVIVPVNDIIMHTESGRCPCAPTKKVFTYTLTGEWGDKGTLRTRYIHNAMDGRSNGVDES